MYRTIFSPCNVSGRKLCSVLDFERSRNQRQGTKFILKSEHYEVYLRCLFHQRCFCCDTFRIRTQPLCCVSARLTNTASQPLNYFNSYVCRRQSTRKEPTKEDDSFDRMPEPDKVSSSMFYDT